MRVNILCFGATKEIVGKGMLSIEVSEHATVEVLLETLRAHYPALEKLTSLAVAVNSEYVKGDFTVHDNDEIALIPPVSGG